MKAVVFAYHAIGARCLEVLLRRGCEVLALYTHEDDPKEEIWFRRPAEIARSKGIPVFSPANPNETQTIGHLRSLAPDFIFSFYYRLILGEKILCIPKLGALNLHGSLLPKYRGRAPINWAIVNGETETGVTLHFMTKRADAGDIVAQKRVAIDFEDTALTLAKKMEDAAGALVEGIFPNLVSGIVPRAPQIESEASKFRGRTPEDGRIDWNRPAVSVYNLVRAVNHPYPGAFGLLRGKKCYIWWGKPAPASSPVLRPGEIRLDDSGFLIGTGQGQFRVERCQFEGEGELSSKEFVAKNMLQNGEVFDL